jgi:hypothetical protein
LWSLVILAVLFYDPPLGDGTPEFVFADRDICARFEDAGAPRAVARKYDMWPFVVQRLAPIMGLATFGIFKVGVGFGAAKASEYAALIWRAAVVCVCCKHLVLL